VTWQILGGLLARRGDFAGAAAQYREYLRMKPDGAESQAIRARLADAETRANAGASPESPSATFRTETNLALVRFQVIPPKGRLATGLRPEDIEIREDGVPQPIRLFEGGRFYPRTVPLEITLLFDCSGSVQEAGTLDSHVFEESLLDEYESARIAIYGFSDSLVRLAKPTRDRPALAKAMDAVGVVVTGGTPLFEYIAETVREAASSGGNATRMIVVFSDGESTKPGDAVRSEEAVRAALDLGVAIYPVLLPHLGEGIQDADWALRMAESRHAYLNLAAATGGQKFEAIATRDVLPAILKAIAAEVRYDYVAGFYPASSGAAKRHKIEVVLRSRERGQLVGGTRNLVH
jgi:VWFA-related protein